MRQSIVKSSLLTRSVIKARLIQLELRNVDVVNDAIKLGRNSICKEKLSRYLNKDNPTNALKEEDIIWLSIRYCISLTLNVDALPYNETQALLNLKTQFNDLG
jgi:hypothetical protein